MVNVRYPSQAAKTSWKTLQQPRRHFKIFSPFPKNCDIYMRLEYVFIRTFFTVAHIFLFRRVIQYVSSFVSGYLYGLIKDSAPNVKILLLVLCIFLLLGILVTQSIFDNILRKSKGGRVLCLLDRICGPVWSANLHLDCVHVHGFGKFVGQFCP